MTLYRNTVAKGESIRRILASAHTEYQTPTLLGYWKRKGVVLYKQYAIVRYKMWTVTVEFPSA